MALIIIRERATSDQMRQMLDVLGIYIELAVDTEAVVRWSILLV